jgi:hypothetical protein
LGRWGGSHATAAGEDVGVALRRGLARTPCVAAATPAPPLRLCVAACKLGVGGVALGRSGGSTATWARCRPWNAGLQAVAAAPPPQLPRLHLGVAACKLGGGGVAFNLLSIYYTYLMVLQLIYYLVMWKRPACPPTQAGVPSVRRPACFLCACALLPETWGLGASPLGALLGWQQRHRERRARGGRCPQTRASTQCVATAPLAPTVPAPVAACHLRCTEGAAASSRRRAFPGALPSTHLGRPPARCSSGGRAAGGPRGAQADGAAGRPKWGACLSLIHISEPTRQP